MTTDRRWVQPWQVLLVLAVALSRLPFISHPYFVDAGQHVNAIMRHVHYLGQPPGYFLYCTVSIWLQQATRLSPELSLSLLNIMCSAAGAFVFSVVVRRLFGERLTAALSFAYGFSVLNFFTSDVHSSYATMTLFAPLLLYAVWFQRDRLWIAGVVWALMSGFRPSDGVFVSPFVAYAVLKDTTWRQRGEFLLAAVPLCAMWYIPTALHYGGIAAPFFASHRQAHSLANGLLAQVPLAKKAANLLHVGTGAYDAWNILAPFAAAGLFLHSRTSRQLALYSCAGMAFYLGYFFSDAVYLSYLVAPGFILIGQALQRLPKRTATVLLTSNLVLSFLQIAVLRPVPINSKPAAIADAFVLQYSGWALRHSYFVRLHYEINRLEGKPTDKIED